MKRALVLILLVAACGGGDEPEQQSPKAAYLDAAEAICKSANADLAAAKKAPRAAVADIAPYVHGIVEVARKNVQSLGSLPPPPDDAADLNAKVYDPLRAQLRDAEAYDAKVAAAAKANDQAALFQLATSPPTETKVDLAFMKSYGFEACVTAADTSSAAG